MLPFLDKSEIYMENGVDLKLVMCLRQFWRLSVDFLFCCLLFYKFDDTLEESYF